MVELPFEDRTQAGRLLARTLSGYARRRGVVVLALPRGGVPVAFEVARALEAPLDVFLVRKLGVPGHEELALGAIATGGALVLDRGLIAALGIPEEEITRVIASERAELSRRERLYREGRPLAVTGKTVIVVDDGVATGSTMLAAITALAREEPARIVVAVPVAPPDTAHRLRREVDELVTLAEPESFGAVGFWYRDFSPVADAEVRELLRGREAA